MDYRCDAPICYDCDEQGHISTNCQKPKKARSEGKFIALIGAETTSVDRLIRGMFFINNIL